MKYLFNPISVIFLFLIWAWVSCNPNSENQKRYSIEKKYYHSVNPSDTTFVGVIKDINPTRSKKPGDIATYKTNNIYISSQNILFLVNMKTPCFKVGDSVRVVVEHRPFRFKGDFDIKATIYPKFGSPCETYGISNETERKKMCDELKKLN